MITEWQHVTEVVDVKGSAAVVFKASQNSGSQRLDYGHSEHSPEFS